MLANKIDIDSSSCCRNTLQRNPKNFPVLMDGTYSGTDNNIWGKCVQQTMSTLNLFVATINCRIIKLQLLIANELCVEQCCRICKNLTTSKNPVPSWINLTGLICVYKTGNSMVLQLPMLCHLGAGVHENFQRLKSLGAWHQFHTSFRKGKAGLTANKSFYWL